MKRAIVPVAIAAALTFSQQASAIEFDGFLTAGFSVHDQDDARYLDAITDDVRFENDSKFGLQVTADVADNMQVVAQILASGSDENFDLDVEWAYLDWQLSDSISLRGGKVKEPVFLISDYIEVGYAYPWIRPPQEVYTNNPINTINGLDLLYQTDIGGMGLTIQPYLGSNTEAVPEQTALTFDASNFYGAMVQLSSQSFTFQLSFLNTDVAVNGPFGGGTLNSSGTAELISAGFSTDINNFVGYAEFVTRDIEAESTTPIDTLFPDQDAWYVTVGYRMGNFLPHLTVANSEAEPAAGGASGVSQDSITLGLRYEINDSAAFKFEVQSIEPTASSGGNGLFAGDSALTDDKATLVSMAVDVIF